MKHNTETGKPVPAYLTGQVKRVAELRAVIDRRFPSVDVIIEAVCAEYGVEREDMLSDWRAACISRPRYVAIHLTRLLTKLRVVDIGLSFSRDHSIVSEANRSLARHIVNDPLLRGRIERIRAVLGDPQDASEIVQSAEDTQRDTTVKNADIMHRNIMRISEDDPALGLEISGHALAMTEFALSRVGALD